MYIQTYLLSHSFIDLNWINQLLKQNKKVSIDNGNLDLSHFHTYKVLGYFI